MRIAMGTFKGLKIQAFRAVIKEYGLFPDAQVEGLTIASGVPEQPMTFEEIQTGARNRAVSAFLVGGFNLAVGIESGLLPVIYAPSEMLDICICTIFDGQRYRIGMSSGVEFPKPLIDLVLTEKLTVRQSGIKLDYIKDGEGLLEKFTDGRLTRLEHVKQAVRAALVSFVRPDLYL